jgi:hypothetical protein
MSEDRAPGASPPTKVLNLRGIPLPLYTQLKVLAAAANMGIRQVLPDDF